MACVRKGDWDICGDGLGRMGKHRAPREEQRTQPQADGRLTIRDAALFPHAGQWQRGRRCRRAGQSRPDGVGQRHLHAQLSAVNGEFWSHDFETVHVDGALMLGNFTMTFVDLEVPVAGMPITVTRTYDTLACTSASCLPVPGCRGRSRAG